jgi:Phage ABA sandwich domain
MAEKQMQPPELDRRELDLLVSENVLGHQILGNRKGTLKERTRDGQVRPLRPYSSDINAAWEVVRRMGITLIPIENDQWFGLVGKTKGWASPGEFLKYLQTADFVNAGAAVADTAPLTICLAALKALSKG